MSSRCDECGFDYADVTAADAAARVLAGAGSLATVLSTADDGEPEHRTPGRWSAVEYGAHVRDVLLVQRDRVLMTRMFDTPAATPMGRDERVRWGEYDGLRADDVARQVREAADRLARTFSRLGAEDWQRRLVYNYPERAERTLVWLAANTVHELMHHEQDIRQNLGR